MKTFWKIVLGSLLGCLVAMLIAMFIFMGMLGSAASSSVQRTATQVVKPGTVLKIDKNVIIAERAVDDMSPMALMNRSTGSKVAIYDAIRAIDAAAADPAVKYIYLNPEDMAISISATEELRAALKRFRDSGKAIVAYADNFSNGSYYLASVADKIILNTNGTAMIMGVATSSMFLKDLLDELGVDVQLIRHGKYKSAGEMFIKNAMSAENREQTKAMVDGLWASMADEICASRGFSREELDAWVNNLELEKAQDMLDRKMVDTIYYRDQLREYLCGLSEVESLEKINFVDLNNYASSKLAKQISKAKDKIAVLYANGEIVTDGDSEQAIVGKVFAAEVEKLRKDSTIKAVVFRVNSPGGSVQAAQFIRREIQLLQKEKPVVASYGDYAASGGYWISASCDKIFSDNTTLTGSIGVFSMIPNIGGGLKKTLKINPQSVSSHAHSDAMGGMRSLDAAEVEYMQKSVEDIYDEFLTLVSEGRDLSKEAVDDIAQGRVWCGCDAFGIGLADEKGGLKDAIEYAAAAAGLEDYKVEEYPKSKTTMERLMEMFGGMSAKAMLTGSQPATEWERALVQIDQAYGFLRTANHGEVFARMPFVTIVK